MHVNDIGPGGFCKKIEIIVGFLHEHKLSHEQEFNAVLKGGTAITSYPLRFLYIAEQAESANFQVAISVPKKHFHNAVDRNLLKRRIREGVRHSFHRNDFENLSIQILIVYCSKSKTEQAVLEQKIESCFQKILEHAKLH